MAFLEGNLRPVTAFITEGNINDPYVKIFIWNKPVQFEALPCHYMKAEQDKKALRRENNLKRYESWVLAVPEQ
jgi:hypothetical protein